MAKDPSKSRAVLGGLVIITSYMTSPAIVAVPGVDWSEPALVWLCISMPTGSTKSVSIPTRDCS